MRVSFLLLPLLTACSITEADFQADFPAKFCAYAVPCVNGAAPGDNADTADINEEACSSEVTDTISALNSDEACTFDAKAAQACLDGVDAAGSCTDAESVRDACEGVFTGDSCDLHLESML